MRISLISLGLIAVTVAACRFAEHNGVDRTVASASAVWSGGALVMRSLGFVGADSVPIITVGTDTLVVRAQGPDSVLVAMPDTNGVLDIVVRYRNGMQYFTTVRVYGLRSWYTGPSMDWTIAPWPGSGPTALGFVGGHLVRLDYRTGAVSAPLTPDTGLNVCNYSPAPSATVSGLVTVHQFSTTVSYGNCGRLLAVPVIPEAAPPDTGPQDYTSYPVLHLSRGHWLVYSKNEPYYIVSRTDTGFVWVPMTTAHGEPPYGYVASPRGDRIVPTFGDANAFGGGVPVFDATALGVAYGLTDLGMSSSGAFTPNGDTLFVTGSPAGDPSSSVLLAVDAATGKVLGRALLSASSGAFDDGLAVVVDSVRSWVYVANGDPRPSVEVYDRATLTHVATLRSGSASVPDLGFRNGPAWAFVMNQAARRLYLTFNNFSRTGPTFVFEYDLMP